MIDSPRHRFSRSAAWWACQLLNLVVLIVGLWGALCFMLGQLAKFAPGAGQ